MQKQKAPYSKVKERYLVLAKKYNRLVKHYEICKKTLKRLLYNYRVLKHNYAILHQHASKKVMSLVDHLNNVKYQMVLDEFRHVTKVSEELLTTIEMSRAEFQASVYMDILFERFLPQPDRMNREMEVREFRFPIMLEHLDCDVEPDCIGTRDYVGERDCGAENTYPFVHLLIHGKVKFSKTKNLYEYYLTIQNITSKVELEYFQKTDGLINSLSISNFNVLKAKKTIEMHKYMLISLTCSLVGEYSKETSEHLKKMQQLTTCLAQECKRLGLIHVDGYDIEEYVKDISYTSVLHDIGKMAISQDILDKDGDLSPEEKEAVAQHPIIGANYIRKIIDMFSEDPGYAADCAFLHIPWEICRHHHERWDGQGYPDGLEGHNIPIAARIVSVADSYEAMRGERVYNHNRKDHIQALSVIRDGSGFQFDPAIVDALFSIEYKIEQIYRDVEL